MAHLIGGEDLRVDFPAKTVLDGVTVGVADGDRVGIVGRNGDGKSTLMKVLMQRMAPHDGRVTQRNALRVGMLAQEDDLPGGGTVQHAIVGDADEHTWLGDARIRDVLDGLTGDLDLAADVTSLSGGQRRRVALAKLLVGDWDVIALDEPTNHLDVEGISWLAQHLDRRWQKNQGALLLVTHDRWFLDAVCTRMWEVHDGIVDPFEGGYAAYVLQRVERQRQAAVAEEKRQNIMRKELAWLRRGAPARTSKPKFRIDAANQLIENEPPVRDAVQLTQLATARLGKDVVDLLDAGVVYDERDVLNDVTWRIAPGERTGILGANGAGKSTLLGLISGAVEPTSGRVKRGKTVRIAYLDQRLKELDEVRELRVREVLARQKSSYVSGDKELSPSQLLERLGFRTSELSTPVKDLSGGQKRRLQLLLVLLNEPNVLILDEPSNDLDTDMLAAMEDLLDSWPGTLLVVSHDRYLLERVTDQQYAVLDGRFRHLPGGVDQYLELRAAQAASGSSPGNKQAQTTATAEPELSGSERRSAEKELSAIERKLANLQVKVKATHAEMAAHDQGDFEGLGILNGKLRDLQEQNDALEERWLELSELLS
ncbi:ABC-F family ATP-binding cassette domain-containing protein [Microbacterium amylolyticum]|uniref:ATPase subunit of ABC transporter with duplicated ATPase domains n=1 Tax=Microbacterium amylolyticum TaxID=936337 RepID=A0ABS4ZK59_9MICO|nr:ABC-F family ATP-binding cassette domain-containing protein [Microbacterium amylolyticum]MBP2437676.1 ATPase subunit of ABC transporter with duplicated ATPase domains [Microbacterium amylolyticum]